MGPQVARVMARVVTKEGRSVDLLSFTPEEEGACSDGQLSHALDGVWNWKISRYKRVPLHQVWPCLNEASLGATVLKAAYAMQDHGVTATLSRTKSEAKPLCWSGH